MTSVRGSVQAVHQRRSELLMCVLVIEIAASPLGDYHPLGGAVLAVILFAALVIAAKYMASRQAVRRVVLPVSAVWFVARGFEAFASSRHLYAQLAPVAGLALSCAILWAIFDHVSTVPLASRSALAEAVISYLVLAIAFSQLYWILNRFLDHAFNQSVPLSQTATFLYFSMTTLTCIGYGAILPVNPYVRMVAALESMAGVFYIAVIVARLVAAYQPAEKKRHEPADAKRRPSIEDAPL